jgi:TIR domain/SIR2-like domain
VDDVELTSVELRELRGLVERIKRGDCVLVLGPRIATRVHDSERRPLDEQLARELLDGIGDVRIEPSSSAISLRRAADLYYRERRDRDELELAVQEFYARESEETTQFHGNLAQLPFRLCISASPDSLMLSAFKQASKSPQMGYYNFKKGVNVRLALPTAETPLVYYLFGHHDDAGSLVLTEGDLIDFLVAIVRGNPAVPDQVRSILAEPTASFLFLGFGFHNWYLRVLLQVMNVYNHRSKAIAFEDKQFFDHPDREQVVGFFSGDRLVDFRPLRWEAFARQIRQDYENSAIPKTTQTNGDRDAQSSNVPKVFVSYASEDRSAVEALAEKLEERGIRIWQDKQDLRAGDDWNRVLLDVIAKRVDYVVVIQTDNMAKRVEGVFHREIAAALKRQEVMGEFDRLRFRFLIAVKMGDCELLSSLASTHVIDVTVESGIEALAKSILEDWGRRGLKSAPGGLLK